MKTGEVAVGCAASAASSCTAYEASQSFLFPHTAVPPRQGGQHVLTFQLCLLGAFVCSTHGKPRALTVLRQAPALDKQISLKVVLCAPAGGEAASGDPSGDTRTSPVLLEGHQDLTLGRHHAKEPL